MIDYLIITHLPAFYKVNLYNALAKTLKIKVVFTGASSKIRTHDFTQAQYSFACEFLSNKAFENRNRVLSLISLYKILRKENYKKLIISGWDLPEYWLANFLAPKAKLCLALESSVNESALSGWKKKLKELFLKKISTTFASGENHKKLLQALGYRGQTSITEGVGIFNRIQITKEARVKPFEGKFLYVGRLSLEKNLPFIINYFNANQQYCLSCVGQGPEGASLKKMAGPNINFIDHVPNERIFEVYQAHDVLILPSLKEPWGLVVEEALYYGLPVVVSDTVGCAENIVVKNDAGVLFCPTSETSLQAAIETITQPLEFQRLKENVQKVDFIARDKRQIGWYIEVLA